MSGLSKHMMHPIDNLDLTFEELKEMVTMSFNNDFKFKEKIDGFGLHLVYIDNEWRIVRAERDLVTGGVSKEELDNRFDHNEKAKYLYGLAIDIANKSTDLKRWTEKFPNDNKTLYSLNCDIVNGWTNTIPYENNPVLYVHDIWKWNEEDGSHEVIEYPENIIRDNLRTDPRVSIETGEISKAISSTLIDSYLLYTTSGFDTIVEYYQYRYLEYIKMHFPSLLNDKYVTRQLFNRIFRYGDIDNIRIVKKTAKDIGYIAVDEINMVLDDANNIRWYVTKYLKIWCAVVGTNLLKMAHGYVNEYKPIDLNRLGIYIYTSSDYRNQEILDYCHNNIFATEGITFKHKNNIYKWTGSFAPINKMMGDMRYINK